MSDEGLNKELVDRVRSLLQRDKIRLWEAPYTDVTTGTENIPQDLIVSICAELGNTVEEIQTILSHLRRHALEKLAARQRADWINLKIRLSGSTDNKNTPVIVNLSPQSTGQELEKLIEEKLNLQDQNLKMICSGRIIQLNEQLQTQNIRNNSTILVIAVPKVVVESASKDVQRTNLIEAVKEAARILDDNAFHDTSNDYRLKITDQQGRELTALSDNERRSLMVAMTLHEKGRSFLRQKDYLSALALFSEADNEFKQCSSQLLNAVDNWGLLNLDIVWCYLCMRNVNDLQDAAERLKKCDACFVKVYGNSFERLKALQKDGMGHMVLFVRLHLLQAIVGYHDGRKTDAKNLLGLAEEEARMMQVEPEKLTEIMLMGYTATEARRGLRSSQGDIDRAVEFILDNRRTREERRREEREKEEEKKIQNRYGRTQNGQQINVTYLRQLQSMGYSRRVCAEALKQANNRLEEASDMLLTSLEALTVASGASNTRNRTDEDDENTEPIAVDSTLLPELIALGADPELGRALLMIHKNQLERAAEELLQVMRNDTTTTTTNSQEANIQNILHRAQQLTEERAAKRARREEDQASIDKRQTILDTIVPDLLQRNVESDESQAEKDGSTDYLDLLLDEEEEFIREYRQKLLDDGMY